MFWLPLARGRGGGLWAQLACPQGRPCLLLLSSSLCQVAATSKSRCSRDVHGPLSLHLPGGLGLAVMWGWLSGARLSWGGRDPGSGSSESGRVEIRIGFGGLRALSRGPLLPETRTSPGGRGQPCGGGPSPRGHLPRDCSAHPPQGRGSRQPGAPAGRRVGSEVGPGLSPFSEAGLSKTDGGRQAGTLGGFGASSTWTGGVDVGTRHHLAAACPRGHNAGLRAAGEAQTWTPRGPPRPS